MHPASASESACSVQNHITMSQQICTLLMWTRQRGFSIVIDVRPRVPGQILKHGILIRKQLILGHWCPIRRAMLRLVFRLPKLSCFFTWITWKHRTMRMSDSIWKRRAFGKILLRNIRLGLAGIRLLLKKVRKFSLNVFIFLCISPYLVKRARFLKKMKRKPRK